MACRKISKEGIKKLCSGLLGGIKLEEIVQKEKQITVALIIREETKKSKRSRKSIESGNWTREKGEPKGWFDEQIKGLTSEEIQSIQIMSRAGKDVQDGMKEL